MCDYSLMALPNRLAVCGDELARGIFLDASKAELTSAPRFRSLDPTECGNPQAGSWPSFSL
jgi:hypothetical protein